MDINISHLISADIETNKCFIKHCLVVKPGPKGEDLNCKVLFVMVRHLNILKYFNFFRNRISLDLNYSRLAGTSLTVITGMFQL